MKLQKFKVTNFRSIIDSGWIECDDVTSLVGVNEAGKSNIILALWKLNPARNGEIDPLHDMPNKEYTNWRNKTSEVEFITAVFDLDIKQKEHMDSFYGYVVDSVCISRKFDGVYTFDFLQDGESIIVEQVTKVEVKDGEEKEVTYNPKNYIKNQMPNFVYYSNYGNLDAQIYLPHAVKLLNGEKVDGFNNDDKVRTLRVLFEYVGLEPKEVLSLGKDPEEYTLISSNTRQYTKTEITSEKIEEATKSKEERTTLLNSASSKLTKDFKEWWKQGEYRFRLQADGDFFKIWVSDDKRPEEIELERRSTGLQWFLSFYLTFLVESKDAHKGSILLLDEAGLTLHPMAQKDLASFFDNLSSTNQLIHTTHSPFLIDTTNIDRVKVVYSDEEGYTVATSDLRATGDKLNAHSIYAVHSALGLSVSDILLNGCQPIIVEGVSDQCYLNAIKLHLIRNKKFNPKNEIIFIPSGGVRGVAGITSIVSGKNGCLPYVLVDSDKSGVDARNKLKSSIYATEEKKLIEVGQFIELENSEIEDLIPFTIMQNHIDRFFKDIEDMTFAETYNKEIALIPQIEDFANKYNVNLVHGWKVVLAKSVKRQIERNVDVEKEILDKWIKLFSVFNK